MMAALAPPEHRQGLEEIDIHGVLSNERRRMTLQILGEAGEPLSARELSERIAELETEQSPPPRNIRQSAYVSLLQTHLPKLDELDIVEYDDATKTVRLSSTADQVSTFMGDERGASSDEIYLIVSAIGLGSLVASRSGVPFFDPYLAEILVGLTLLVVAGFAAYRASAGGWPLLRRIRE